MELELAAWCRQMRWPGPNINGCCYCYREKEAKGDRVKRIERTVSGDWAHFCHRVCADSRPSCLLFRFMCPVIRKTLQLTHLSIKRRERERMICKHLDLFFPFLSSPFHLRVSQCVMSLFPFFVGTTGEKGKKNKRTNSPLRTVWTARGRRMGQEVVCRVF